MPTIVRRGKFAVKVYGPPQEHPPPHVHVRVGADGMVIVRLPFGGKPLQVRSVSPTVRGPDLIEALWLVEEHEAAIMAAWEGLHGH
jgi:hypothetical protein